MAVGFEAEWSSSIEQFISLLHLFFLLENSYSTVVWSTENGPADPAVYAGISSEDNMAADRKLNVAYFFSYID